MRKLPLTVVICVCDDKRIIYTLDSINYDVEVVIVLNGSNDDFKKNLNEYIDKSKLNVKILEIPTKNLSKARQIGTEAAKYDKVVYYDSDTIVYGDGLKYFSEYLDKYLLVDGKVKFKSDTRQSRITAKLRDMGLPGFALCPAMGLNKKIKEKVGFYFDPDIKWIEDAELNRRAQKENIEVGFINELTCIHDNLTFKKDLSSAYKYGYGTRLSDRKRKRDGMVGNWFLVKPGFKDSLSLGLYIIVWNIFFVIGYITH